MTRPKPKGKGERELRAKIFRTGRSQAVRLPKEVRFEEDQRELRVRKEGSRVILEPLDEWPAAFLEALGTCPDFPEPPERTPLRDGRDRFGR
jgi:antitoxin VapB